MPIGPVPLLEHSLGKGGGIAPTQVRGCCWKCGGGVGEGSSSKNDSINHVSGAFVTMREYCFRTSGLLVGGYHLGFQEVVSS